MKKNLIVIGLLILLVTAGLAHGETFKIGVHAPMTGPAAEVGRYIKNGALMAVEDINAAGGILGRKVEVVLGDTEAKPEVGVSVYERFMTKDKADAVIGGLLSSVNIAMQETAAKYDKVYISGGCVSEVLTDRVVKQPDKYWMYFKTSPAYSKMKPSYSLFFKYLKEKGFFSPSQKKLATIGEDTDYGRSVVQSFQEAMKEDGWSVIADEFVKIDQADFTAQMSKLRGLRPEVLFACQVSPAAAASLCKAFYQSGVPALFLVIYTPSNPEYIKLTGATSNTLLWATTTDWVPSFAKEFLGRYQAKFNEKPGQNVGIQYDAMMNFVAATKLANSLDSRKIADALTKIKNPGLMGVYRYDRTTHESISGEDFLPVWFHQIIDGESSPIYPDRYKTKTYTKQKWLK